MSLSLIIYTNANLFARETPAFQDDFSLFFRVPDQQQLPYITTKNDDDYDDEEDVADQGLVEVIKLAVRR